MGRTADLSVIMATYNHAAYLPRALRAVLDQSVRPAEVIVIDDASTDGTGAVLAEFARQDPVVRVVRNERNLGSNRSVNLGMSLARCEYVFSGASDDCVLPGFIEKTVEQLERHPRAGLCCSYFSTLDGVTGEVRANATGWCDAPRYFTPAEAERVLPHWCIPGHTTVCRRSSFLAAGGYLDDLEWHSDWFVHLVIAFREGMCHVPEMLALWRVLPESYSSRGQRDDRKQAVYRAIIDRLRSPEYRDVAPAFRRTGVIGFLGPDVLRAAAPWPDVWDRDVLALVGCLRPDQYEELLEDPDPAVRDLASFFLGPFGRERIDYCRQLEGRMADLDALRKRLERTVADRDERLVQLDGAIRRMEGSAFWKARRLLRWLAKRVLPLARPSGGRRP